MPSEQFKKYHQRYPMGKGMPGMENMPGPGMKNPSGEWLVPTMPEGFEPVMPPLPSGFVGEKVMVNGVKGVRVTAPGVKKGRVFMHIHGGGFTIGSAVFGVPFMLYLVKALLTECYSVEYSLAPKHKFPTPINECLAFYQGLLEKGYEKIVIGGESAGATLSIAVTHAIKDKKLHLPAAVIALSPVGDLSPHAKGYTNDMFVEMAPVIAKVYVGSADLKNPYISPLYGDFKNFPPLLLQAGGGESLAADSVNLAEAAAKADVEVLLHIWQGMGHCFAQEFGNYPEADSAMQEIVRFIRDRFSN
jgi:epsilon-lactone hydrolase